MKLLMNRWQLVFDIDAPYVLRSQHPGWRTFAAGVIKLTVLPLPGQSPDKRDYRGVLLSGKFFLPWEGNHS